MREEFERQGDAWENGVPVDEILEKLKARITDNERASGRSFFDRSIDLDSWSESVSVEALASRHEGLANLS